MNSSKLRAVGEKAPQLHIHFVCAGNTCRSPMAGKISTSYDSIIHMHCLLISEYLFISKLQRRKAAHDQLRQEIETSKSRQPDQQQQECCDLCDRSTHQSRTYDIIVSTGSGGVSHSGRFRGISPLALETLESALKVDKNVLQLAAAHRDRPLDVNSVVKEVLEMSPTASNKGYNVKACESCWHDYGEFLNRSPKASNVIVFLCMETW